jgi:hypothetical protein
VIGRIDCELIAPPLDDVFEEIIAVCRRRWPHGAFLDGNETDIIPLDSPLFPWRTPSWEFFVFSDKKTAEEWDELGPCPENWNRMLHFLCRHRKDPAGSCIGVTVVVDEVTPDIGQLLKDLQSTFRDTFFFASPQAEAASQSPQAEAASQHDRSGIA